MLQGKKTYIVAAIAIVYAVTAWLSGHLDSNAAIQVVFAALGAAGLRNGVATEVESLIEALSANHPLPPPAV